MAEYRTPGQIADSRRWGFIRATGETVPEVWADLRERVQPMYSLALENIPRYTSRYDFALRGAYALSAQVRDHTPGLFRCLSEQLHDWGAAWNLTPQWCERYALKTLHYWNAHPDYSQPTPFSLGDGFIDPRPMLERPETPKEFRDANAHRAREGWQIETPANELHVRWLALYQCRGASARAIGWEYAWDCPEPPSEEAIYKAVQRCARSIQLPLRPRLS